MPFLARAQVNVLTQHNDVGRSGANLAETVLNTSNVNPSGFGKLFTIPVDGQLYAQPLYMSNVNIGGKVRNLLFLATTHDSLYCFDADTPGAAPIWHDSFINPPSVIPVPYAYLTGAPNINPEVGIIGTPVLDPGSDTIYVVTKSLEGDPTLQASFVQRLHAVDILNGAERANSPVELAATVSGTGDGGSTVSYSNKHENQRPALLLVNGTVYVAAASHGDHQPYHGWVLAYDAKTLQQTAAFCATPNGIEGGYWQSGQGPAADGDGNIYLMSGNGTFTADPSFGNGIDYGDSFVKLRPNLTVEDFFSPYNQDYLSSNDEDLGSAGVLMIPGTTSLIGGGKEGVLYLMENYSMGHFNTAGNDGQIVESHTVTTGEIHGSPVYWNGPAGAHIYLGGTGDHVMSFAFNGSTFNTNPTLSTDINGNSLVPQHGPGGFLSISANGNTAGTGILWASYGSTGNADGSQSGVLYAFDAATMRELWGSDINLSRDGIPIYAKFTPPTVANGKVYEPTFAGEVIVYGLLGGSGIPNPPANLVATPNATSVSLSWSASTGATSYSVKRSLVSGSGYQVLKSGITATSYSDTAVTSGTTYYYVVTASNSKGQSGNSAEVSATPGGTNSLTTIGDSYTHSTTPTTSYGMGPIIRTKYWSATDQRRIYIKFDISKLPAGFASARLQLYGSHLGTASVNESAYEVSSNNWTEQFLDWNNQPAIGALINTTSVTPTVQFYDWDVTSYIKTQKAAGATQVTIALQENARPADGNTTEFHSLQYGSNPPQLLVVPTNPVLINFANGFANSAGLQLNGDASINGSRLQLTEGLQKKIGTSFYSTPVPVTQFSTAFSFQLLNPQADGFTFTIQGVGPTAMGQGGGSLGYGELATVPGSGIGQSVAIKFDLHDNAGEGPNSTGIFTNGAVPTVPAINLTPSGVNLHSGDVFNVTMTYNGATLTVKITDSTTGAVSVNSYPVNIGSIVGSTGYVGFTGATGFDTAVQQIVNWTYSKS